MSLFGLFKRKPKSEWKTRYVAEYFLTWGTGRNALEEKVTFYLKEDQFGNRKYDYYSYGNSKASGVHKEYEANMILWVDTGVLPKGAKDVLQMKLSTP
jgi:hypothetical protein